VCKGVAKTSFFILDYWSYTGKNIYYLPFVGSFMWFGVVHNLVRDPSSGEFLHVVATTLKGGNYE
jgi:hypothetical protein